MQILTDEELPVENCSDFHAKSVKWGWHYSPVQGKNPNRSLSVSAWHLHTRKRQKLTKAEHCLQCLIGSTLAFKINAWNTLKVQNSYTGVLYDLKSATITLLRNLHTLKVCLNTAWNETTFQWLPMETLLPYCFLIRPSSTFMHRAKVILIWTSILVPCWSWHINYCCYMLNLSHFPTVWHHKMISHDLHSKWLVFKSQNYSASYQLQWILQLSNDY